MAHIRKISFYSAPVELGCRCDRCDQWIKNVWSVMFDDGVTMRYGMDCFDKLESTGKLSSYGKKLLNHAMKNIKKWEEKAEEIKRDPECIRLIFNNLSYDKDSYWHDKSFDEFVIWYLNEVIPDRLKDEQKTIDRFKSINFTR